MLALEKFRLADAVHGRIPVVRIALSVLVLGLLAGSALAAERVNDAEHGFTFLVPSGFVEAPQDKGPHVLHAYRRGNPSDGSAAMLQLIALEGTIGRERLKRADVEKAMRSDPELKGFDYREVKWKSYALDLALTWTGEGEQKVVTLTVQVPLEKQAVQVEVGGLAKEEAELVKVLDTLLAGLDGRSSWEDEDVSSEDRDIEERSAKAQTLRRLIGVGSGLLLVLATIMAWKQRHPRGRP